MRRRIGKKGIETYVGFVLLIGFVVSISVFMYAWINSQVETSTQGIEERADTATCEEVGISIKDICQNTQTLNMNITNVKLLGITQLRFRFFDLYDNTESRSKNITIRPGDTQRVEVLKQGTLRQAEIIPIIRQDDKIITCTKSMIKAENIKIC